MKIQKETKKYKSQREYLLEQAQAFKDAIHTVILLYMKQAIASDRATVAGLLDKQGHKDMADIIRRL